MKKLIVISFFIFTFFSCKTNKSIKEQVQVTLVNSKNNNYNFKIKNNSKKVVVLLDVFSENKIRDINFFLPLKNRILNEELGLANVPFLLEEKVNYEFFSVNDYAKYDTIEKFVIKNWQNKTLKHDDFIFILPNESKELIYNFEEIKTYHLAYKEYNLSQNKSYKFQIRYKLNKEEILKKCTDELKLLIIANQFDLYDKEILSNQTNYIFKEKKGLLNSIIKRKRYWYTND